MASLPFEEVGSVAVFPDGRRFVCTVYSSHSDVWIVEHFDPSADVTEPTVARRAAGPVAVERSTILRPGSFPVVPSKSRMIWRPQGPR
jgi:hypothetical protein